MFDKENEEGDDESSTMLSGIGLNGTGCHLEQFPSVELAEKNITLLKSNYVSVKRDMLNQLQNLTMEVLSQVLIW